MKHSDFETNNIRGPINAWVFKILDGYMNYLFGKSKKKLFKNHPETIVEIGSGTGANMRYLKKGTRLIAIEPNIYMHNNLKKNAAKYGINLEIKTMVGESIGLPDNSCDFVVSTLVLCTVNNPVTCIKQIKRILKPSGFLCLLSMLKLKKKAF
ncbi:class I SAM-dependent methyltransferase [Hwangdonia seohaensis]|uniref:Class I SAM-dependent methyltransferase n=1 Tax=Hwangdonia seohaensis TaxID=1240727 RepID=A0ABW3RDF2_9FLAO|nr:class I SAM-dependent methyltransferase [Hwangdonia seohaensis]